MRNAPGKEGSRTVAGGNRAEAEPGKPALFDLAKVGSRPWEDVNAPHGFLGRAGGISQGPYESLNFSYLVGDNQQNVDENWRRLRAAMPVHMVINRVRQVHGNRVLVVGKESSGQAPSADGAVTRRPGILLTVLTADCVPVLMVDSARRICGAIHAGWRGALANIASRGVEAMAALGADRSELRAALGPSIGPCCFEVDLELAKRFAKDIPGIAETIGNGRPGKAFIDLKVVLRRQLEAEGVNPRHMTDVGPCTRCARDRYFSRRGADGAPTGLQLSFIGFQA